MDRTAIEELLTFTDYSWREHEQLIRPLGDEKLTEPAPGSGWPALRDALVHINWAYIRWLADPAGTTDEPVERVTSWDELGAYRRRVRDHARVYIDSLSDDELMKPRGMNVDGETLVYSRPTSSRTPCCTSASTTETCTRSCISWASRCRSWNTGSRCPNGRPSGTCAASPDVPIRPSSSGARSSFRQ